MRGLLLVGFLQNFLGLRHMELGRIDYSFEHTLLPGKVSSL